MKNMACGHVQIRCGSFLGDDILWLTIFAIKVTKVDGNNRITIRDSGTLVLKDERVLVGFFALFATLLMFPIQHLKFCPSPKFSLQVHL